MDFNTQIDAIINQAVAEKTFSLEVINQIKELKEDFESAQKDVENLQKKLDKKIEEIDKLNSERAEAAENITKLQTKIDEFEANIKAIEERERKVEKVEWDACFQKQRADEIKQIFEFTLRSPMIRRSISESAQVPVSTRDGYASTVSTNRTVTETVEEPRY